MIKFGIPGLLFVYSSIIENSRFEAATEDILDVILPEKVYKLQLSYPFAYR